MQDYSSFRLRCARRIGGDGAAVEAGKYRFPITIRKFTETQSIGEPVLMMSVFANVWANYEDIGGSEGPAGGQQQFAIARRRYEIRPLTGLQRKMRVFHQGLEWDIDEISEVLRGLKRELHLFCTGRSLP